MNFPARLALFTLLLPGLPLSALALTPSQVFDKVKDSVVVIKTQDSKGEVLSQGSGVLLPSGKIATNCHVVKDGFSFQVGRGKSLVPATLFAGDEDKDICLLQTDKLTGTPAQLGKAVALKVGEPVYAVGAPQGLELSLSDGIVSALRGGNPPLIQTTAAISHGSSGGGLFDSEGRLVGFTTLYIADGQSLNFAMPVEWLNGIKPGKKTANTQRSQIDWLTHAAALEEKKDWSRLLDWGTQWIKAEPKNAGAWFGIGRAQENLNQLDQAIAAYRQGLRINPEFTYVWNNLGNNYADLKRYDDAIAAYHQALRINPEYANAWGNLGSTYADLKRYDDAITAYRQALRINPEDAKAWYNLGLTYASLKRHDDAIAAYHQALRIDPEYASAWNNLAIAYYLSGNTTAAVQAIMSLRQLDPVQADELFNLIVPR